MNERGRYLSLAAAVCAADIAIGALLLLRWDLHGKLVPAIFIAELPFLTSVGNVLMAYKRKGQPIPTTLRYRVLPYGAAVALLAGVALTDVRSVAAIVLIFPAAILSLISKCLYLRELPLMRSAQQGAGQGPL